MPVIFFNRFDGYFLYKQNASSLLYVCRRYFQTSLHLKNNFQSATNDNTRYCLEYRPDRQLTPAEQSFNVTKLQLDIGRTTMIAGARPRCGFHLAQKSIHFFSA